MIAYRVEMHWEGEGGSWNHGFFTSDLFLNRKDAENFAIEAENEWNTAGDYYEANTSKRKPEVVEVVIHESYQPPMCHDDGLGYNYQMHICRED